MTYEVYGVVYIRVLTSHSTQYMVISETGPYEDLVRTSKACILQDMVAVALSDHPAADGYGGSTLGYVGPAGSPQLMYIR